MSNNITPAQCRAARGWLKWSQDELAGKSGLSVPTIARFEREETAMSTLGQSAVVRAFNEAGILVARNVETGSLMVWQPTR